MALSGQLAFYEQNKNLIRGGSSVTVTSGTDTKDYILGTNKYFCWTSVGSDDLTTETIEITFPTSTTIDRIFLIDFNFKDFDVMYDVSSVWTNFSNVVGLDGAVAGGIIETTYDKDTAYYEFDSITTTKIRIRANTTQIVDAEKFLRQFISTVEIGTLDGYPGFKQKFTRTARKTKTVSGKVATIKSYDVLDSISVKYKVNPFQNDQDIIERLYDEDKPFLIWPCSGKYGASDSTSCPGSNTWFKIAQKGWDLKDITQVQTDGKLDTNFYQNIYKTGTVLTMDLTESID